MATLLVNGGTECTEIVQKRSPSSGYMRARMDSSQRTIKTEKGLFSLIPEFSSVRRHKVIDARRRITPEEMYHLVGA